MHAPKLPRQESCHSQSSSWLNRDTKYYITDSYLFLDQPVCIKRSYQPKILNIDHQLVVIYCLHLEAKEVPTMSQEKKKKNQTKPKSTLRAQIFYFRLIILLKEKKCILFDLKDVLQKRNFGGVILSIDALMDFIYFTLLSLTQTGEKTMSCCERHNSDTRYQQSIDELCLFNSQYD